MLTRLSLVTLVLLAPGWAQMGKSALAGSPKVEIKGTIEKIQLEKGQGVPYLELKTDKGTQKVVLGSMRYLMEKNFNPKAGEVAAVVGFQMNSDVMAQSVTLTGSNTTLALRDDNGMPLWRGGRHSGGQGQHKKQ
jgi:hypothetical protein